MERAEGLNKTYYEISDLLVMFSMSYWDALTVPKNYGTGESYTVLEAHMVTLIEKKPGITITETSKYYKRSPSAISQLISRLEKKGLVYKSFEEGVNQKAKRLFVTPKGREVSQNHIAYDEREIADFFTELLCDFSPEDLNTVYKYMERMLSANHKQ